VRLHTVYTMQFSQSLTALLRGTWKLELGFQCTLVRYTRMSDTTLLKKKLFTMVLKLESVMHACTHACSLGAGLDLSRKACEPLVPLTPGRRTVPVRSILYPSKCTIVGFELCILRACRVCHHKLIGRPSFLKYMSGTCRHKKEEQILVAARQN